MSKRIEKNIYFILIILISVTVSIIFSTSPNFSNEKRLKVEIIAKNLEVPWSLDFLPDNSLIFTERNGNIKLLKDDKIELVGKIDVAKISTNIAGSPENFRFVTSGLLGLAVDPDFKENNFIYVYYTSSKDGLKNKIERLRLVDGKISERKILLDNIPANYSNVGGRIKFGPDKKLYITTGDAINKTSAQDLNSLAGKILRINPDGSIPSDNPFPNSPVYAYGFRNPQGLAWNPVTKELFATEHGTKGNDEINIIRPGKNYGWPEKECESEIFENPLICYFPDGNQSIAPSGLTFYSGERLPYKNNLFFASLVGKHLHRIEFEGDFRTVKLEEKFLTEFGRIRDVVEKDGFLYVATSNRDFVGIPKEFDDVILKIG